MAAFIEITDQIRPSMIHGFVGPQHLVAVNTLVPLIDRFTDLVSVS